MNSGIQLRLDRLFRGKRNLVISAVDHVVEYGVQKGLEKVDKALRNCADVDAMLLPRFMLERNWRRFAGAGAPVPVVRLNGSASFYYPLEYREGFTTIVNTVEEAVRAGAGAVICLGADLIKTFYTGPRFNEVIDNTPVPVFTIGADKLNTDLDVLRKAHDSVQARARGIIFGRPIFMSRHPERLMAALNEVINANVSPEKAVRQFKL